MHPYEHLTQEVFKWKEKKGRSGGFSWATEATLYEQAQGGCQESLNELMERHEGLVRAVVERQWLLSLPYEEALQAVRAGFWRAIMGYDPRRGTTFATYAYPGLSAAAGRAKWTSLESPRNKVALKTSFLSANDHLFLFGF